jgi:hypothetical protein
MTGSASKSDVQLHIGESRNAMMIRVDGAHTLWISRKVPSMSSNMPMVSAITM